MRIFVTGGTGFIGSHFLNVARAANHEVVALRRSPESKPRVSVIREPDWLDKGMAEVTSADLIGCDVLVHFAAYGVTEGMNQWDKCFEVNVTESLYLWQRAVDANIKRFVICGSCFEYGRSGEKYEYIPEDAPLEPVGAYHASKAAASMAAIALGIERKLELAIIRPFHVFGRGESKSRFWSSMHSAAERGEDFVMTRGEQIRDFVPVEEVAKRFLNACGEKMIPGMPKIKNLGSCHPQTLRDFAEYWWRCWGARGRIVFGGMPYRSDEVMRYVPKISSVS